MMQQYHTGWDDELLVDGDTGKLIPLYICICFAHESSECVCGGWDVDIQEWEELFGKIEQ